MKRSRVKQLNVGTSQHNLLIKPYGFCCDIADYDPRLPVSKEKPAPLFPLSGPTGEGPDIKFRIQENDDDPYSTQRKIQKSGKRTGQKSGQRYGQRSGPRGRLRNKYRGTQQLNWKDASPGRRRVHRAVTPYRDPSERMICKRCRGPLRWYLEDEIAVAREIMMKKRQDKYNAEMEKNIKIAKKKEKRRRQKRKKMLSKIEEDTLKRSISKEDTDEGESKNIT